MVTFAEQVKPKRTRTVFVAGKLERRNEPRPCHPDHHVGPLLNTEKYDALADASADPRNGFWRGQGECAKCGSTIHVSQIRRTA